MCLMAVVRILWGRTICTDDFGPDEFVVVSTCLVVGLSGPSCQPRITSASWPRAASELGQDNGNLIEEAGDVG